MNSPHKNWTFLPKNLEIYDPYWGCAHGLAIGIIQKIFKAQLLANGDMIYMIYIKSHYPIYIYISHVIIVRFLIPTMGCGHGLSDDPISNGMISMIS